MAADYVKSTKSHVLLKVKPPRQVQKGKRNKSIPKSEITLSHSGYLPDHAQCPTGLVVHPERIIALQEARIGTLVPAE